MHMMIKVNFEKEWIRKIMGCVKSVSFFVLINEDSRGWIKPSRSLGAIGKGILCLLICFYFA